MQQRHAAAAVPAIEPLTWRCMRDSTPGMSTSKLVQTQLPALLSGLDRPGDFCGSGALAIPLVRLRVEGVGLLGLPLPDVQAAQLAQLATPAPYGRGPDTLVDPQVRRCGQVAAERVDTSDPRWAATMNTITAQATAALGVDGAVQTALYKLLVYQPGDFFTTHRDTEKERGMFGTLVVVLPSKHEGGELVVRHAGREATLDLAGADLGTVRWAAFYADCQHELLPLRTGWRVALIYNLVRKQPLRAGVPDHRPVISRVQALLKAWATAADGPVKLVMPLQHRYSLAELSFQGLKSQDAAVAEVLAAASTGAGCEMRLAMVSIEEAGPAEPEWDGSYGRYGRHHGDEAFEIIEISERTQRLVSWRRHDDSEDPRAPLPYLDEELAPPGALDDLEPDDQSFTEATGNEGGSFERTYRQACLVLWPARHSMRLLHQGGTQAALNALDGLLAVPGRSAEANELAGIILAHWPRPPAALDYHGRERAQLIGALRQLDDAVPLWTLLWDVVAAGAFTGEEGGSLVRALERFDEAQAGALLLRLATNAGGKRFVHVATTMRSACHAKPGLRPVGALVASIAAMRTIGDGLSDWVRSGSELERRGEGLAAVVEVAARCGDAAVSEMLAELVLADSLRWPLDEAVVPAVLAVTKAKARAGEPAFDALRHAALIHLRARIALPLEPPSDARRSAERLTCRCVECGQARLFLDDPSARTWSLRAAKFTREHVMERLQKAGCDVDLVMVRTGSPHILQCTKNQASYDARVAERRRDQLAVGKLAF
jgi:2OG-Fe(II) oxygenase superfamily